MKNVRSGTKTILFRDRDVKGRAEKGPVSEAAQDLIKRLMDYDPLKRHTMAEAANHPWCISRAIKMDDFQINMSAFELMQQQAMVTEEEDAPVFHGHDLAEPTEPDSPHRANLPSSEEAENESKITAHQRMLSAEIRRLSEVIAVDTGDSPSVDT